MGMWLSRKRDGRPKRNLIPGIVILLTGWAMSGHPQSLHLSTMVHTIFGYTLMAAGATRIVEIAFVLRDRNSISRNPEETSSFQYLPPFVSPLSHSNYCSTNALTKLLYASGFLFMGATEEQMALMSAANVTHVAYVLVLYSVAFLLFLFVNVLLHIYAVYAWPTAAKKDPEASRLNGHVNGHARTPSQRLVRDAEEFELEGLMSDGAEDAETPRATTKRP